MTACAVRITNPLGMHARAAARFVHTACAFQSRVRVAKGSREMDGKSIMGLLLLAAARGTTVTITAEGVDESDAVATLRALVERGFDDAPLDGAQGLEGGPFNGGPFGTQGGPCV